MMDNLSKAERAKTLDAAVVDLVVQIACLALLAYWTIILLQPLLSIILWSVILAVLLYPAFDWMVGKLHMPRVLAALVLTVLTLAVLIGPATWLGLSLAASVRVLAERLGAGDIAVPAPPETVKGWPLLGERIYGIWLLASTNLRAALGQIGAAAQAHGDRPAWIRRQRGDQHAAVHCRCRHLGMSAFAGAIDGQFGKDDLPAHCPETRR